MRVLFINASYGSALRLPQGLHYLASTIQRAGHEVVVYDEELFSNEADSLA